MARTPDVVPVELPVHLVVNGRSVPIGIATVPLEVSGLKYDADTASAYVELAGVQVED